MKVSELVIALAAIALVATGTAFGHAEATIALQQPEIFVPVATATSVPTAKQAATRAGVQQPETYALSVAEDSAAASENKAAKEDSQKNRRKQGQRVARSRWGWMW